MAPSADLIGFAENIWKQYLKQLQQEQLDHSKRKCLLVRLDKNIL